MWTGQFIEILTLMVLVIIHELGHMVAADAYHWKIESLELLPFGGVVRMDNWGATHPREEIIVALAGPFQHVFMVIASLFFYTTGFWDQEWTEFFIHGNLVIAGFNLLPIHPLDGGRIMQALLSLYFPYRVTLYISLMISCCLSSVGVLLAFLLPGSPVHLSLLIITVFLLSSNIVAFRHIPYQYLRFIMNRAPASMHKAPTRVFTINVEQSLYAILQKLYRNQHHFFRVMSPQGKLIGVYPEEFLIQAYLSNVSSLKRFFDK